jgi:hypothetical protein
MISCFTTFNASNEINIALTICTLSRPFIASKELLSCTACTIYYCLCPVACLSFVSLEKKYLCVDVEETNQDFLSLTPLKLLMQDPTEFKENWHLIPA